MTRQELLDAIPGFVEANWPKNDTAALGGERTPGRGEAVVAITRFILEVMPDDQRELDDAHLPGAGARQLWSAWECHDCEETGPSESGNADAEASAHAVAEGHHTFASHVSGRHYFGPDRREDET